MSAPTFYCASVRTPGFSFEAYGLTVAAARMALVAGWLRHASQRHVGPDYATPDDIAVRLVSLGACYRDGEELA